MTRALAPLADSPFDLLVIGGGIVGACTARDAARRGLRVALLERSDFGSGVSWNSLKIVHGGLRSLQALDIGQARAFVRERRAWLRIAPHLVDPLSFLVPARGSGRESAAILRAGLALNDLVSRDRNNGLAPSRRIPRGRAVSRAELHALVPDAFRAYTGGVLFHDAQLYSAERLVYAVLEDAEREGARIANHVEAVAPLNERGVLAGVIAEDLLTGARFDVRASMIVNAAGARAPALADTLLRREGSVAPMTSIALNLMLDGDPPATAFALASQSGGALRRLFVAPWRGRTLIGTAHYDCTQPPRTEAELEPFVERFVREASAAWPARAITRDRVLLVHRGMQPGAAAARAHGPGEHTIVDHARDGGPQLLSAIGPKLTTARLIAEQLVSIAGDRLHRAMKPCDTASAPLHSAPADDLPALIARARERHSALLPPDVIEHLARWYGAGGGLEEIVRSVRAEPALGARLAEGAPAIAAQLRYAMLFEHAEVAEDLLDRRTELGATARLTTAAREAAQHAALAANPGMPPDQRVLPGRLPDSRGTRSR